ncbi:MAG TPA: hypothetical protein VIX37_02655 [Candidatus Sulfotelmatobacter sp.]
MQSFATRLPDACSIDHYGIYEEIFEYDAAGICVEFCRWLGAERHTVAAGPKALLCAGW